MDSKLVIEQMAGRWQVKHANLKPLAAKARALIPAQAEVRWTWIPRAENSHADRLANGALDGGRATAERVEQTGEIRVISAQPLAKEVALEHRAAAEDHRLGHRPRARHDPAPAAPRRDPAHHREALLRHRASTRRCPSAAQGQARAAAEHLAARRRHRRHRRLAAAPRPADRRRPSPTSSASRSSIDDDLRECDFGDWDGLTFAEASARLGDRARRVARQPGDRAARRGEPATRWPHRGSPQAQRRILCDARRARACWSSRTSARSRC